MALRLSRRNDRACVHTWPFRCGGARSSVMDVVACSKCARCARFGERGSLRSINLRRGKGESLTLPLSAAAPLPSALLLRLRASLLSFAARLAFTRHR
jgi:hypothetical protein